MLRCDSLEMPLGIEKVSAQKMKRSPVGDTSRRKNLIFGPIVASRGLPPGGLEYPPPVASRIFIRPWQGETVDSIRRRRATRARADGYQSQPCPGRQRFGRGGQGPPQGPALAAQTCHLDKAPK